VVGGLDPEIISINSGLTEAPLGGGGRDIINILGMVKW